MRQKLTLLTKTMLLLCALIAGSGSAWAEETETMTATLQITSSVTSEGNLTDDKSNTWAFTTDGTLTSSNSYIQAGTNNATVSYIKLSTSAFSNKVITKVQVWGTSKANTNVTAKVKIGSTTIGTSSAYTSQTASSGGTEYSVDNTDEVTGDLFIEISRSSAAKGAIYFNKAIVTYKEASTDPSSDVAFASTSPSINYPATKTYSQVATTATGYTGTVTYTITDNSAGATIEGSTVTVTKGGSVTVKATAPAITGFKKSEATYTLTVNDTRTTAGLSWSASTASVTYGTTPYSLPTLTNTHGVPVNYGSTDEDVATIDNYGVITVKNVSGSTTISAEFEGNDEYLPQTVSYTLEVEKGPYEIIDGVFDFVEAGSSNPVVDYGSGVAIEKNGQSYVEDENTWIAGNVTMVTSGKYRWWYNGHDLRFYNTTPYSAATFSVPNGYVITKIVTTGGNFVSESVGELSGNTWTGASQSVKLSISTSTVNFKTITVTYISTSQTKTVGSYGWATYIAPAPVSFAANTAYVVSAADVVNKTITVSPVTSVPAGTPVLLKGEGEKTITVAASASAPETNLLEVCDGTAAATGYNYFVLAKDGTSAAFMQWTGDLDDITGKVVLPLELDLTSGESRNLRIIDDEGTGISQIKNGKLNIEHSVFDLQGRRVKEFGIRNSELQKGLYIVNGKKVMMK